VIGQAVVGLKKVVRHELVVRRELMDSQELQVYVNGRESIWIEVGYIVLYSGMSGDID
jgi:hypothetical protein